MLKIVASHALLKQGFEVSRGYPKLWAVENCDYTFDHFGLCFGNNPAAPYVLFSVRPWPDEFVDPNISTVWTKSPAGYEDLIRFDPREAIIILGANASPIALFLRADVRYDAQGNVQHE